MVFGSDCVGGNFGKSIGVAAMTYSVPVAPTLIRQIPVSEQKVEIIWTENSLMPEWKVKKPRVVSTPKPRYSGKRKRNECNKGHKMTEENIYIIGNKRRCRTCQLVCCAKSRAKIKRS